ncbi:MAG: PatB family C-S lyase [Clostridia bacterium]|nr:PatB family C-S lyase [Clostridia bacterium]
MSEFDQAYFDRGLERRGTECVKWDAMLEQQGDPEMIPMWVADMDFPSAPAIQAAVAKVAAQGTWGYTRNGDRDSEALSAYWQRRHGVSIRKEDVLMSPCVVSGMRMAVQALTKPGDGVLINPPIYGPFFESIRQSGRTVVESPLIQGDDNRWTLNIEEMDAKLAAGEAQAVMFCSPHNPCGRAWSREELSQVLDLCRRYKVPLICDEIHADFVYAPCRHTSILTLASEEDAVLMLCAASKTFNVAGLQQSSMVSRNAALLGRVKAQRDMSGVTFGNPFALAATRAAYTDCDAWLDGLLLYLAGNRDLVVEHAKKWPKVRVTKLEATYLMWLDCRQLGMNQEELGRVVREAHVFVTDGLFFGSHGEGFIRLNIGCPRAQVEAALRRLDTVFAK